MSLSRFQMMSWTVLLLPAFFEVALKRLHVLSSNSAALPINISMDWRLWALTLDGTPDPTVGNNPVLHPLLRRWDQQAGDPAEGGLTLGSDNAALVIEGTWLSLEDGVQIFFEPANPVQPPPNGAITHLYRPADYWLIPARTATGDVEWPRLTDANGNLETDARGNPIPLASPPHGVKHHYAPLVVLSIDSADGISPRTDCRGPFETVVETDARLNNL